MIAAVKLVGFDRDDPEDERLRVNPPNKKKIRFTVQEVKQKPKPILKDN